MVQAEYQTGVVPVPPCHGRVARVFPSLEWNLLRFVGQDRFPARSNVMLPLSCPAVKAKQSVPRLDRGEQLSQPGAGGAPEDANDENTALEFSWHNSRPE